MHKIIQLHNCNIRDYISTVSPGELNCHFEDAVKVSPEVPHEGSYSGDMHLSVQSQTLGYISKKAG